MWYICQSLKANVNFVIFYLSTTLTQTLLNFINFSTNVLFADVQNQMQNTTLHLASVFPIFN